MITWCKNCILPDTRPNLTIESDGVCDACHAHQSKPETDWTARAQSFRDLVRDVKSCGKGGGYDCIIPVSGGKDSTWQVITALEYGLKVLAVSWRPPGRTALGQQNLDNLISLGVEHMDFTISPRVESVFMRKAFERFGTPAIPMHMAIYNMPLRLAAGLNIPLVLWGENSADEYGGGEDSAGKGFELTEEWLVKYGVTGGTKPEDWIDDDLSASDLLPYYRPAGKTLADCGVTGAFLGYYFPWDPATSLNAAVQRGFKPREQGPKVGFYNYADIDDDFISVHHYLKWYKFGFTRLFDNLSLEIRNHRKLRDEAINIVRELRDQKPEEDILKFCQFLNIDEAEFYEIAERFRNRDIWRKDNGAWKIENFLIPDWEWV